MRLSISSSTLVETIEQFILMPCGYPNSIDPRKLNSKSGEWNQPKVTLTWAQSLDSRLAGSNGQQIQISGEESMFMTHMLRRVHDGILVGIGTVRSDNPRLNVRLKEFLQDRSDKHRFWAEGDGPQPIVIDSRLEIPLDCKLLTHSDCKRPWIATNISTCVEKHQKAQELLAAGCELIQVSSTRTCLREILHKCFEKGIQSLMVEGGARVLKSFLQEKVADNVIVTVSPQFIGSGPQISDVTLSFSQENSNAKIKRCWVSKHTWKSVRCGVRSIFQVLNP